MESASVRAEEFSGKMTFRAGAGSKDQQGLCTQGLVTVGSP